MYACMYGAHVHGWPIALSPKKGGRGETGRQENEIVLSYSMTLWMKMRRDVVAAELGSGWFP